MGLLSWLRGRGWRPAPKAGRPATGDAPGAGGGFVVVDVETTGLVAGRNRIVEIAVVRTDPSGRVIDEWATLVNPGGSVGPTRIHGISGTDVLKAPRFPDIVGELTARLAGRAIVAHNARFDLAFIEVEYARAGWTFPAVPYLCTLEASWTYLPDLARRRLADCCGVCDIPLHDAHSALGDARATAQLLAAYLDPARGVPPRPEHVDLPGRAGAVGWPPVPPPMVTAPLVTEPLVTEPLVTAPLVTEPLVTEPLVTWPRAVGRPPRRPVPAAAAPGTLWALLDALPLATAVEEGAPAAAQVYLELLCEVLEDGVLTDAEAGALVEVAQVYALTRDQVQAAHRGFLLALAHAIVEDGKVGRDERAVLVGAAQALGFREDLPNRVLDEARAAFLSGRAGDCQPLPPQWSHGEPLRLGDGVAFTGGDQLVRARLEGRAQAAGLRVTGSVSGRTAVLVTDGANPHTTKAVAARDLRTRVVTPAEFAVLVEFVQPARDRKTGPVLPFLPGLAEHP